MSYPTCRRYPRSMAQAFPREHANPIEVYRRPRLFTERTFCLLVCLIGLAGLFFSSL